MATSNEQLIGLINARLKSTVRAIDVPALRAPIVHVVEAGGKRLRPLLALLACEAAGGRAGDALDAAAAVELLHTFTLVHDDIMDNAALRRGRPTVHTRWNASTAILAGDTIAALAMQSLVRRDPPRAAAITRRFAAAFTDVCVGQALDEQLERARVASMPAYLHMIAMKTAALFAMSAALGGECAGATSGRIRALERFGRELGLAFQIRDDALDIGADPEKFGKDDGGDIRQGKKSYLFVAASALARAPRDRALLARYVRDKGLRGIDAVRLRLLYTRGGALAHAERDIAAHTTRALTALRALPKSAARNALEELAGRLLGRTF